MQIERAKPHQASELTAIALAAKRHWDYPERWLEAWSDVLTITPEFITSNEIYVAMFNNRAVGFYALGRKDGRLDLVHLWVLPDFMGRGIGRSLFRHGVERARELGFREFHIESDPNAAGFYERMAARRVGTTITEIDGQTHELPLFIYELFPM